MEYRNIFDYKDKKIDFGYIYAKNQNGPVKLSEIVDSVKENIIIYDSNDYVIDAFLSTAQPLLNNLDVLVIGLVNLKTLDSLTSKGVNGGFFRSTDEHANAAIIIVDKKHYYVAFDKDNIYKMRALGNEVYNYINYLIWSKTSFEFCQGRKSQVTDTRLSVVKPAFDASNLLKGYDMATDDFNANALIMFKEEPSNKNTYVFKKNFKSGYVLNDDLNVNIFENYYGSIEDWMPLVSSISFFDKTIGELFGKQIWVDGHIVNVKESDSISRTIEQPLDEYKSYKPNFESIASEYNDYTKQLEVVVNVLPLTLDSTYKLSDVYAKVDSLKAELNKNLAELSKLIDDKKQKKQLETIIGEKLLEEQVSLYNKFINELDFGVRSLNIKNPFSSLKYDKSMTVPSDLIGKLYTKGSNTYLALKDEARIDDANKWLRQNDVKAVLIKENA